MGHFTGRHINRDEIREALAEGLVTTTANPLIELWKATLDGQKYLTMPFSEAGVAITVPSVTPDPFMHGLGGLDVGESEFVDVAADHMVLNGGCIFQLDFQGTFQIDNNPAKTVLLSFDFDGVVDPRFSWVATLKAGEIATATLMGHFVASRDTVLHVVILSLDAADTGKVHSAALRALRIG
jgi:hypothetical protein